MDGMDGIRQKFFFLPDGSHEKDGDQETVMMLEHGETRV